MPEQQPHTLHAPPEGNSSVHLDALRGFAAFSVMFSHWRDLLFVDYPEMHGHGPLLQIAYFLTGLGHQWVIIFFVLSGYLVGGSVLRAFESGRWSWRQYLFVRMTRLYTVLIPALALAALLLVIIFCFPNAAALFDPHTGQHAFYFDPRTALNWPTFFGNLAFLQGIKPIGFTVELASFAGNGPLWSLSNELWYYLAFPALLILFARKSSLRVRIFYAVLLAGWLALNGWERVVYALPWLAGAVIFYLPRVEIRSQIARRGLQLAAFASLWVGLFIYKRWFGNLTTVLIGFIVAYVIWTALNTSGGWIPALYQRVARWSAHISYTLYLVHLPFLVLLQAAFHLERSNHFETRHMSLALLCLPLIVLYSQIIYWLFERNTDKIRKWLTPYVIGTKKAA